MEVFMGKPICQKCLDCSKISFRGEIARPECWAGKACEKKRSWYRNIDHYREIARKNHHYHRYDQDHCAMCSSTENLQAHHIKAQINGGEHTKTNIMTLCETCHRLITKYYQAIRGLKQVES